MPGPSGRVRASPCVSPGGRAEVRPRPMSDPAARVAGLDGRWALRNSFNGKTLVDIEAKGKPSKWIPLRALLALGEAAR